MDPLLELHAIEKIKQLKAKYCYYVDEYHADPDNFRRLLSEVFLDEPELDFDFGPFGHFKTRGQVEAFYRKVGDEILSFSQHLIHSPIITVESDDRATGRWHFLVPCTVRETGRAAWISGIYDEVYRRRGDAWFIGTIKVKFYFLTHHDQGWARENLLAPDG